MQAMKLPPQGSHQDKEQIALIKKPPEWEKIKGRVDGVGHVDVDIDVDIDVVKLVKRERLKKSFSVREAGLNTLTCGFEARFFFAFCGKPNMGRLRVFSSRT